MWLFTRVPPHVHDQHVLGLEGFLLARTVLPLAHEGLLAGADVILVQMLDQLFLRAEVAVAAHPVAMSLYKVWFLF